jgi:hypothetical protein
MPEAICNHCHSIFSWHWEEAFAKWGFSAGQGQLKTETVQEVLTDAGYKVEVRALGACNTVICSIKNAGKELIPEGIKIGYVQPRLFLPCSIIELLDRKFPSQTPYDGL